MQIVERNYNEILMKVSTSVRTESLLALKSIAEID